MKKLQLLITAAVLAAASSLSASTTLIENFPGDVTGGLSIPNIDGNWHGNATNWSISSNVLSHSGLGDGNEGLVGQMIAPTTSGSKLSLSFDYNVGSRIFVHLRGFDVTAAEPTWWITTWANNGNAWNNSSNGDTYNLHDGLLLPDSGNANNGDAGEAVSFTGSGTASLEIDISGHTVSDIADYEYIMLGFGVSASGENTTSTISNLNLSVAVPEPSSTALIGIGTLGFLLRRRR